MVNTHASEMRESSHEPSIIVRLYALILPYRRTVAAGMGCLLLSVAAELYPPLVWQRVVDVGLAQRDWGYIARQLVLLVLVSVTALIPTLSVTVRDIPRPAEWPRPDSAAPALEPVAA